jgi:hypothetical protein
MQLSNPNLPAQQNMTADTIGLLLGISDIVPSQLAAPTPALAVVGVTGATTYTYVAAALSTVGIAPSVAVSVTNGYAALSAANNVTITFGAVPNALGYAVYRTAGGGSQGLIALLAPNAIQRPAVGLNGLNSYFQVVDTGLGATAVSANAPTGNTTGQLQLSAPIFSTAPILEGPAPVTISATTGQTLTPAQFLNPLIIRSGPTAGFTDTTPSAAALVAAFPGVQAGCQLGTMYRNTTAYTATQAYGTGVTGAAGNTNTTATLSTHMWWLVFTNVTPGSEAVTAYSLGSFVF